MPREDMAFISMLVTMLILSSVALIWLCFEMPILGAFLGGVIVVWALVYFVLRKLEHDARCHS